jgi:NAD(P)H-dependent flavin oxidoreductase YrpB (nitropropane dioxygenase family)
MSALELMVPIMQAPLGGCATPQLVSAVSQAGGLGTLAASWTEPHDLRERIRSIARATDRPFCVNLVLEFEQDGGSRCSSRSTCRSSRSPSDSSRS